MSATDDSKSLDLSVLAPIGEFRYPHRVAGLREQIAKTAEPGTDKEGKEIAPDPIDALLVTYLDNSHYLTGFTGSNALLIVSADHAIFITDGRYGLQSASEVPGFERVVLAPGTDMGEAAAELVKRLGLARIGYEKAHLTVAAFDGMKNHFPESVALVGKANLVEVLRRIKDADEIAALRKAIVIA
ncbi:MAG: aminopeptidase P family N-terminal domain-containing protein, partial [Armatimonadota bacterium]